MATFDRRIGRLVSVRPLLLGIASTQVPGGRRHIQGAVITAVGVGNLIDCRVRHAGGGGLILNSVPRWSRSSPATVGWVRE